MAKVRFFYDVYVDEDEVMENLSEETRNKIKSGKMEINDFIIDRASTLFSYDIQDREVNPFQLEAAIIE